ncbi:hypothetical protein THAOC_32480, partial [Thalassiosira oceanica]
EIGLTAWTDNKMMVSRPMSKDLSPSDLVGRCVCPRSIARDVGDKAMNKMLSIENDAALVTLKGSFESILRLILKYGLCRDLQLAVPNLGLVLPRVPRLCDCDIGSMVPWLRKLACGYDFAIANCYFVRSPGTFIA